MVRSCERGDVTKACVQCALQKSNQPAVPEVMDRVSGGMGKLGGLYKPERTVPLRTDDRLSERATRGERNHQKCIETL